MAFTKKNSDTVATIERNRIETDKRNEKRKSDARKASIRN